MPKIFVLIEQALGYALLQAKNCKSTDDLVDLLKERNIKKLVSEIELVNFHQFTSMDNAARNCTDIANGIVSDDLRELLASNLCKQTTKKSILIINDKKLLESLKSLNLNSNNNCNELSFYTDNNLIFNLRELRHNIHLFLGRPEDTILHSQIGLGHGYSRIKIKYNANRSDNMIIQTINLIDQMDKDINTMSMRLREWFGYHYPELVRIVPDLRMYARVVQAIKSRAGVTESIRDTLEQVLQDTVKVEMLFGSSRTSMGYELTEEDFLNIGVFADKLLAMIEQREFTQKYLARKMRIVAPNFSTLVGDIVAARLISHAGSLVNLAKFPASTIQILGAEKALFRAIKSRGNTPKYGLIFHSSFIGRAAKGDKGRISRFLAAKISLAVRLDCFSDEPVDVFGKHLKKHVEDQLVYLETGKEPRKNYEMMEEAVRDAREFVARMKEQISEEPKTIDGENNSKKKKKKKSEKIEVDVKEEAMEVVEESKEKKKKKKKSEKNETEIKVEPMEVDGEKKQKKIKSEKIETEIKQETISVKQEEIKDEKKKKKKKNKENKEESVMITVVKEEVKEEPIAEKSEKKKKKKRKSEEVQVKVEESLVVKKEDINSGEPEKKKKKKKNKDKE